jgi:hypothetical protein
MNFTPVPTSDLAKKKVATAIARQTIPKTVKQPIGGPPPVGIVPDATLVKTRPPAKRLSEIRSPNGIQYHQVLFDSTRTCE